MKSSTTLLAVYGCHNGMKCAYLVNLSTTTRRQLNYREVGNPSMKSIVAISQGDDGIGRGWSKPGGRTRSGLAFWQV
jgi:hypothetical protein